MIMNTLGILEICYIFVFSRSNINFKDLAKKFVKKTNNQSVKNEETTVEPINESQDNQ
ncbi:MAG TPA: hypothetical protein P5052_01230 [Candidatus Paceibacterota bacterium]|nr:hypothetical protein [Candidatus Paceibacterota bacterium]